jgi:hypothetical protein
VARAAASLREALARAGQARAADFTAGGYDPHGLYSTTGPGGTVSSLPVAPSTAVSRPVPAWPEGKPDRAERRRRRVLEIRKVTTAVALGMPSDPTRHAQDPVAAAVGGWEASLTGLNDALRVLREATDTLPGPRRVVSRMLRVWWALALDGLYYAEDSVDVGQMEAAAWRLVEALPEARVPAGAAGRLASGHRYWITRWVAAHRADIDHLGDVSGAFEEMRRGAGRG